MNTWLKGLIAAAIGGAAGTLATVVSDAEHATDIKKIGISAGAGALIAVAGYLKQSPLNPPSATTAPTQPKQ